jgi:probable rRNA maturation factor
MASGQAPHGPPRAVTWEAEGPLKILRAKDYATNVTAFDYMHAPVVLVDLVLCAPVIEAQAHGTGLALTGHQAHLLVHRTLQTQGFDHKTTKKAREMESRESALTRFLGVADPYRQV